MSDGREGTCCLCGQQFHRFGNNPDPLGDPNTERCCSDCNAMYVIPVRMGHPINPDTAEEKIVRRYLKLLYAKSKQGTYAKQYGKR